MRRGANTNRKLRISLHLRTDGDRGQEAVVRGNRRIARSRPQVAHAVSGVEPESLRLVGSLRQLVGYLIALICHLKYFSLVSPLNDQLFVLKLLKCGFPTGDRPPIF